MDSLTIATLLVAGVLSATSAAQLETECYTANGKDYRGRQNQTCLLGGKPCLFWNETFQHPYNTLKYPNGEGGLGSHNYCRNPDGDVRPWCYITDHDDGIYWKYCDIPTCQTCHGSSMSPRQHRTFQRETRALLARLWPYVRAPRSERVFTAAGNSPLVFSARRGRTGTPRGTFQFAG
ncbi:hypothetical protein ANANG_G00188780 [Anguilla anguilla]|uniref:Kringle-containing protein marking the eye and the nose n=1 Tax=Anguilla anguilla TaxID=7936 RepID=A0A9D3RRS7_ANGAN|nr:hypothetical protein ANANG_G00188780 [Anguilla anguilla]